MRRKEIVCIDACVQVEGGGRCCVEDSPDTTPLLITENCDESLNL